MHKQNYMRAFYPEESKTLAGASTSSEVTFTDQGSGIFTDTYLLQNAGPNTVFVRWGRTAQTAVVTDFPLMAGAYFPIDPRDAFRFAGITASGQTATLYITRGKGG